MRRTASGKRSRVMQLLFAVMVLAYLAFRTLHKLPMIPHGRHHFTRSARGKLHAMVDRAAGSPAPSAPPTPITTSADDDSDE